MIKVKAVVIILAVFLSIPFMADAQEEDVYKEKRIKVGATFSLNSIGSSNFKDTYGSGLTSVGMDFGFMLTDNIEAWATLAFASKSTKLKEFDNIESKFKCKPMLSLNLRYHFFRTGGVSLFGGGGFTGYQISDKVDSPEIKEVKEFLSGFNLHGGCRYNFADSFYLQGVFRYNFVSKSKKEWAHKLDLNGPEFLFGVAYGF